MAWLGLDLGHGNSSMTYDVHLDQCVTLEKPAKSNYAPGFRFNTYLWQSDDQGIVLDFYIKGFRVKGGFIHLPDMAAKFSSYPIVFLPRPFAQALVEAVLNHETLKTQFPEAFPLASASLLVENLMIPPKDVIRDFPALAVARGLIGA